MIVKNESYYLGRILPIIRGVFDELVTVDAESTDGTVDILKKHGAKIHTRPWTNSYSDARNEAITHCSGDWIFMLDADEAMNPRDVVALRSIMKVTECIRLPRIEFVSDGSHVDPAPYPDWQCRCFRINAGYHYKGRVHETLYKGGDNSPVYEAGRSRDIKDRHIYHYGQCRPRAEVWLKHHNYGLIQKGLPSLEAVPVGYPIPPRTGLRIYDGPHPLKGILSTTPD